MVPGLCFYNKRYEFGARLDSVQGDGSRLHFHVLTATGRKVKINQNKVVFEFALDAPAQDQSAIRRVLAQFDAQARELMEQIDLDLLWDSVVGGRFSLAQMAQTWYGEQPGGVQIAALLRLILEHPMRFSLSGDRVDAVDDATLQKRIETKQRKEQARLLIEEALPVFNALADGREGARQALEQLQGSKRFLDALWQRLLENELHDEIDLGFLKRFWIGEQANERAIAALTAAGREIDLIELTLSRHGLRTGFNAKVLEQAQQLATAPLSIEGRRDLRGLTTFSIDSETTMDYDDALSVQRDGDQLVVWVHITDVGELIERDSELDLAAKRRIATLYLPNVIHPMLPESLCFDRLSLNQGQDRAALSFFMRFNAQLELLEFEPQSSVICVDRNLDFDSTAELMQGGDTPIGEALLLLEPLRKLLWENRQAAGAAVFPGMETKISVDAQGRVQIALRDRDASGSRLVEELMILTNHRAAKLCAQWELPSIYRVQEPRTVGHRPGPSILTLEPGPHVSLGVTPYFQITSPIRRYPDLIMQRQITHHIAHGQTAYADRSELLTLAKQAESELLAIRDVEQQIKRYFTLVFFEQNPDREYTLRAIKPLRDRPDIQLVQVEEVLLRTIIELGAGVEPGSKRRARVERVQPQTGLVEFRTLD
ncbi:MAG: ribonuclease catalytic domain-containing protein [Candidatus Alcyoniella australis]|nr:ribonuclease catalytic domain-containing protein [Candidatus Alcyoniella australis]